MLPPVFCLRSILRVRVTLIDLVGRGIPAQVQEDCLTPSLCSILSLAKEKAKEADCKLAGTEHLLNAILHTPCCSAIAILKKLAKERQKCVIVVTHSKEVAEASDVVLELSRRSLVEKSK